MENSGCKKRTARNYALKDVGVKYLMKENPEVFERLGRKWDGDENSYMHLSGIHCFGSHSELGYNISF